MNDGDTTIESIDVSGYETAAGAAKATAEKMRKIAKMCGHKPDVEVTCEKRDGRYGERWVVFYRRNRASASGLVPEVLHDIVDQKFSDPTDILDVRHIDSSAQTAYDKAADYWESMVTCSSEVTRGGEVLLEGAVPPAAITHVLR